MIIYFFDPTRPESQVLLLLALLLLASGWLFFAILEDVVGQEQLVQADLAIFNFFQSLRTSTVDRIMVAITAMGGITILLPLVIVVLVWLAVRRCWHTAGYWLAAVGSYEIFVQLLKFTLARGRPMRLYSNRAIEQFAFPSGHATSSMVIYGFLAFLLSRNQSANVRIAIMAITAVLVALIGFSRVYLGAHWLSDVLAGFALGLAWIALLAMVYTHHGVNEDVQPKQLTIVVAVTLLISGSWYMKHQFWSDLVRYEPKAQEQVLSVRQWITSGWRQLPLQRVEISGDVAEPFTVQWGDSAAGISRSLAGAGWQAAPAWSLQAALLWLVPDAPVKDLPVLPKFNQGNSSKLAFVYFDPKQPMARTVLRLWRSRFLVSGPAGERPVPIWYGALYREEFRRPLHLITVGVTTDFSLTPAMLDRWPTDIQWVMRTYTQNGASRQVFLILPRFKDAAGFAAPTIPRAAAADIPHPAPQQEPD
jgi:membrane-associated phospholipid phosphatase